MKKIYFQEIYGVHNDIFLCSLILRRILLKSTNSKLFKKLLS